MVRLAMVFLPNCAGDGGVAITAAYCSCRIYRNISILYLVYILTIQTYPDERHHFKLNIVYNIIVLRIYFDICDKSTLYLGWTDILYLFPLPVQFRIQNTLKGLGIPNAHQIIHWDCFTLWIKCLLTSKSIKPKYQTWIRCVQGIWKTVVRYSSIIRSLSRISLSRRPFRDGTFS